MMQSSYRNCPAPRAGWLAFQGDAESRRLTSIPSTINSIEQIPCSTYWCEKCEPERGFSLFPATRADSMVQSLRQDPVLHAFISIANGGAAIPPRCLTALDVAVRRTANEMRLAGRPIERVVAHVKSMATDAGVRESHDRLVADAVLWAITYFYGDDKFQPMPSPVQHGRGHIVERVVPLEVGVDSLSWVIEELDRRGAERCEKRDELGG
jgi:hypothetical protein